jgi:MFS family permease
MFLSAIVLALIVGLLLGGGLPRLADLKLRWYWVLALAVLLRLGAVLAQQASMGEWLPLSMAFVGAYLLVFVWLWGNWRVPGLQVAAIGIGLNTLAVALNGGRMPVWSGALSASGLSPSLITSDPFHFELTVSSVAQFVQQGGIFGDVIPIPLAVIRDVVSVGDVLLAMGIFWAIVSAMTRPNVPVRGSIAFSPGSAARPGAGGEFQAGVAYAGITTSRPMAAVGVSADAVGGATAIGAGEIAIPKVRPQSPYLRLARNTNFGLLWIGQLVSFFGDRIHQFALAFLVEQRAGVLEVGITFAATVIPNVLLGPLAGALVDRWDRRTTMIVCDGLRAGLVLLVPLVIDINIGLVYLIAFLVATVSVLFRPAKNALIPRIVPEDDLVTANSASSIAETIPDLLGYPIAGVLVAALGKLIGVAFILDAATYVISAVLLLVMIAPRDEIPSLPFSLRSIWHETMEGARFLVAQRELLSNTVVSAVAQVAIGVEVVCSIVYALSVLDRSAIAYPQNYAFLMTAIGVGSVVGGAAVGQFASRAAKGPLTIAGFVGMGVALALAGFVTSPWIALVLFFLMGVMNTVWLIPTITLFQEQTPQRLMGRVINTRQAFVFAAMAAAMGIAGWAAATVGPAQVFVVGGAICALGGLGGLLLPSMRSVR